MKFTKMQGAGNNYIYIDCLQTPPPADPAQLSIEMSAWHFGIGGDGIILILPSDKADCAMRIFNNDGSEAQMCGNGIRCVAKYLFDRRIVPGKTVSVDTRCGVREIEIIEKDGVARACRVLMGKPSFAPSALPALVSGEEVPVLALPIEVDGETYHCTLVSTGNPHAVCLVEDVSAVDIERIGRSIENHAFFPERINVEFVQVNSREHIRMRVWERGSGITMACGTGACASAVATHLRGKTGRKVEVALDGGTLQIEWDQNGDLYMTGPAEEVFSGTWPRKVPLLGE